MPGAKTVPFDAEIHYIDQMAPDGIKLPLDILGESLVPYERPLYLVRACVPDEVAHAAGEADKPTVRGSGW